MFQIVGVNVTKNDQMFKWTVKQLSKQIFDNSVDTPYTPERWHMEYTELCM